MPFTCAHTLKARSNDHGRCVLPEGGWVSSRFFNPGELLESLGGSRWGDISGLRFENRPLHHKVHCRSGRRDHGAISSAADTHFTKVMGEALDIYYGEGEYNGMRFLNARLGLILCCVSTFILLGARSVGAGQSEISLRKSVVVIDVGEPSYVHYVVNELRQQIKTATGTAPMLSYDLNEGLHAGGTLLVVGRAMASRLAQKDNGAPQVTDRDPGEQGFVLKALQLAGNKNVVLAAGSDSAGTNYAVMQLRQVLAESASGLTVTGNIDLKEKPQFKERGLYLHQHWRYNYPWATWSWSVEDWKRALDMAAYLRVNLVMLWPHMDMLTPPLSVPEQDYLTDIREVIDYAYRKRGIKIWMVEGPNVLLDSPEAKQLPVERRDYYAFANMAGGGLKNPADPKQFAALMANREALYRAVPNADGYSLIDSDPGGWLGSPESEFVDLFVGNRKLLDQYHERPREAALVYWLLASWGTGTAEENWRDAMRGMEQRVSGPREYLVVWAPQLKLAKELGVLGRSIFFPYGIIEGEPTFPLTNLNFAIIRRSLEYTSGYAGLQGTMANSQTFLMQLPNLYYFTHYGWSDEGDKVNDLEVLRALGKLLFPERAELLAEAWAQLNTSGSQAALTKAEEVEELVKSGRTGRVGTIGSYVFPRPTQVLIDLVTMLHIHASAERVREQVAASRPQEDVVAALEGYLREMLDWQKKNGFFGAYGVGRRVVYDNFVHGSDAQMVRAALQDFASEPKRREEWESLIVSKLSGHGYNEELVKSFAGQLFGTYKPSRGEIEKKIFLRLPPRNELAPWAQP